MLNRRLALTLAATLFGLFAARTTLAQDPPDPVDSLVYITVSFQHASGTIENVSTGSGFIITESGYVLTARHILPKDIPAEAKLTIRGATRSKDNTSYPLHLQETVPVAADVALLYFSRALGIKWSPLQIGETHNLTERTPVYAYGFPYDQEWVLQSGQITGLHGVDSTTIPTGTGFIKGMSGGPVLNAAGHVIGVVIGQADITTDLNYFTPLHHVKVMTDFAGATSGPPAEAQVS
jgi:S1-C subfamily serine protease